jgi:hypothetical protein
MTGELPSGEGLVMGHLLSTLRCAGKGVLLAWLVLVTIYFALAGLSTIMLVDEMRFGSRALSAEAEVVEVGSPSPPHVSPGLTIHGRYVLIRCDKLPHVAIVEWDEGRDAPHPGDRVAILYEPDPQRIGPGPLIPENLNAKFLGTTSGVKLNGFWHRYSIPLLFPLMVGGMGLVAIIGSYLRAKWRGRRASGTFSMAEGQIGYSRY